MLGDGLEVVDDILSVNVGSGLEISGGALSVEDKIAHGNVRAFDTVADMQVATDLVVGMTCHTNGFHSAGDGGAAFYKITASGTANGMDVLACGDVFANLVITESYVTPEMFGAVGDGLTNDTNQMQNALSYGIDIAGNGTYSITNQLSCQNMNIEGLSFVVNFAGYLFSVSNNADAHIRNCNFDFNGISYGTFDNTIALENLIVDNCAFTNAVRNSDASLRNSAAFFANANHAEISCCTIYGNQTHGLIFVNSGNSADEIWVQNCYAYNNDVLVDGEHSGVGIGAYASAPNAKIYINGCTATNNGDSGIAPHGFGYISVQNCISMNNREHGIVLQQCTGGIVSNCICKDNSSFGVRVQGDYSLVDMYVKNCIVSNNLLDGSRGIYVGSNSQNVEVFNNRLVNTITPFYTDNSDSSSRNTESSDVVFRDNNVSFVSHTVGALFFNPFDGLIARDNKNNLSQRFENGIPRYWHDDFGYLGFSYGSVKQLETPTNLITHTVGRTSNASFNGSTLTPTAAGGLVEFRSPCEPGSVYTVEIDFDKCSNALCTVIARTSSNALITLPGGGNAQFINRSRTDTNAFQSFAFTIAPIYSTWAVIGVTLESLDGEPITNVKVQFSKGNVIKV